MQPMMASASSLGLALSVSALLGAVSRKISRTSRVQPGQIAGAVESRRADRIPATYVPCARAAPAAHSEGPVP
jgi:hypothetical protein